MKSVWERKERCVAAEVQHIDPVLICHWLPGELWRVCSEGLNALSLSFCLCFSPSVLMLGFVLCSAAVSHSCTSVFVILQQQVPFIFLFWYCFNYFSLWLTVNFVLLWLSLVFVYLFFLFSYNRLVLTAAYFFFFAFYCFVILFYPLHSFQFQWFYWHTVTYTRYKCVYRNSFTYSSDCHGPWVCVYFCVSAHVRVYVCVCFNVALANYLINQQTDLNEIHTN